MAYAVPAFVSDFDTRSLQPELTHQIMAPLGKTEGNMLVLSVAVHGSATPATTTLSLPAGWTLYASTDVSNKVLLRVFWKAITAADVTTDSYLLTLGHVRTVIAHCAQYSGLDPNDPFVGFTATTGTGASTTRTLGSIASINQDALIVGVVADADLDNTYTPPTGYTERLDRHSPPPLTTTELFPIGVDAQSYSGGKFTTWKNRGVNTLFRRPSSLNIETWTTEANTAGLFMVRNPRSPLSGDASETRLIGWAQPDEPDGVTSQTTWEDVQANFAAWQASAPTRPVFLNLIGKFNQTDNRDPTPSVAEETAGIPWYAKYVAGCTWLSADYYPANNSQPISATVATMVETLKTKAAASTGQPVFAGIECSRVDTTDTDAAPTAAEMRGELWTAIVRGVRGIYYFPQRVVPSASFSYDATTAEMQAEMTKQNSIINRLARVLQGTIGGGGVTATVASPLEVTWRVAAKGVYIIVLNTGAGNVTDGTVTLTGLAQTTCTVFDENRSEQIVSNVITDTWAPYQVHIYVLAN